MAINPNDACANDMLDALDTIFPQNSLLEIRASTTVLATITLPATPWAAANASSKAKNGTWSDTADAAGTADNYILKNAAGTKLVTGTIGQGSGDLSLDNTVIAIGQTVTVSTFAYTL